MKNILFGLSLGWCAFLWGCATTQDLISVDQKLEQKIAATDERIAAIEEQDAAIHRELETLNEAFTSFRENQADTGADVTDIREDIQQLKGISDELRRDVADVAARASRGKGDYDDLKGKLDSALSKISFIEDFLGIEKKGETGEGSVRQAGALPGKENGDGTNKEALYAAAYELFQEGKYDQARSEFQNFLKQFPDVTEYSGNAQFWIAECYYFEKKYENAILEYEKVINNYPGGNKVPHALLKEGISFLNIGDKDSAKLVLERVVKDYPDTSQARTARAELLSFQ